MNHIKTDKYNCGHYRVDGWDGIAFYVLGLETQPDKDTEWTGAEVETGNVVAVMVGDDRKHSIDPDALHELKDDEFCHDCGQIGCGCNVYA